MRSFLSLAAIAATLNWSFASPITLAPRQQICNGNAAYCNRKYSNVSLIGSHDSAFVGPIADPRVNQQKNVTAQLDAGIRFLQAQTHVFAGELSMCHTSCWELYAGSLATYLTTVKTWLDRHPNEVVTMLLVNGDHATPQKFDAVFSSTGLKKYAYVPPTSPNKLPIDSWPTYSQMIGNGTRLVMFLDYNANMAQVPYILDEFTYLWETPYDMTDPEFPQCTVDRPSGGSAAAAGRMSIINHFLDSDIFGVDIPDNMADYQTNAATGNGSIGAQNALCKSIYGRVPNFVLVDMFDRGDVFTAQKAMNAVA